MAGRSVSGKGIAQPLDGGSVGSVKQDAVEATGRFAVAQQPVPRRHYQAGLFGGGDAGRGAAEIAPAAQPDLDKDRGLAVAADQVDLSATHPEVAFDDRKPAPRQVIGRQLFRRRTFGLPRAQGTVRMALMENALYVVATPIGNLGDITLRALETLRGVDLVACEDTRHARRLLDHHGIRVPTLALHQHNENQAAAKVIRLLGDGRRVALVSDAGTPGVSDPGARTVAAARAAGFKVIPLPGPNAAITALSAAGLADERFLFVGFLPAKVGARKTAIAELAAVNAALVFYEAPHRVVATVAELAELLEPRREIVIARELTKMFEQIERMPLKAAPDWLKLHADHRRGEFVLVVSAPEPKQGLDAETERVLVALLAELPVKQAATLAAEITGQPKKALYARALALKDQAV